MRLFSTGIGGLVNDLVAPEAVLKLSQAASVVLGHRRVSPERVSVGKRPVGRV